MSTPKAARKIKTDRSNVVSSIILQGFGWESWKTHNQKGGNWWRRIEEAAPEVAACGFTHIWLPPATNSVSKEGYLPSQLYNFDSAYGSRRQLDDCIQALHEVGVAPVADCVYNHRCGDVQNAAGDWLLYSNAHEPRNVATMSWDESAITCDDPEFPGKGGKDTGQDFHAAPDLDHTNRAVQAGLKDYTRFLISDVNFHGLRFDFSKGYGGKFAGTYARAALGSDKGLAVGEYWVPLQYKDGCLERDQEAHRQEVGQWIDTTGGRCLAFDFGTKGILQEAIEYNKYHWLEDKQGRPSGLIGERPGQAVTFVDNHDTGSTQQHWPFPRKRKLEGYAYILTHPGIPTVFWEDLFEGDAELSKGIRTLLTLRQYAGIAATSTISILSAQPQRYVAQVEGAEADVRVRLGPDDDLNGCEPSPNDGWGIVLDAPAVTVWVRAAELV